MVNWIVKRKESGHYLCSSKISVVNEPLARRFKTSKRAKEYVGRVGIDPEEVYFLKKDSEELKFDRKMLRQFYIRLHG